MVPFAAFDRQDPESLAYDVAHTPCEVTLQEGSLFIPSGVRERFPRDLMLDDLGAEGYIGRAFTDPLTGRRGLLAALMREPIREEAEAHAVLGAFVECILTARNAEILEQRLRWEAAEQRIYADVLDALQRTGPLGDRVHDAMNAVLEFPEYKAFRVVRFGDGRVEEIARVHAEDDPGLDIDDAVIIDAARAVKGLQVLEISSAAVSEEGLGPVCLAPIRHDGRDLGAIVFRGSEAYQPGHNHRVLSRYVNEMIANVFLRDRLESGLKRSTERANRASKAKSMFLATMSHELRSPLNAILGFSEMLAENGGVLTRTQRDHIDGVRRNAKHLLAMISDILDLGKIESNAFKIEREPCAVAAVCNKVIARYTEAAISKGISLRFEPGEDEGRIVFTDPAMFEQILDNLVANAVKFTAKGRVVLRVVERELDNAVAFEVADTGIGITGDKLRHIFEPFAQVNDSYRRRHEGIGLGLSICKELADRLGGALDARSEPGVGSVFSFILPQRRKDHAVASRAEKASKPRDAGVLRSRGKALFSGSRVLVVEDSVDNRTLFDFYLRRIGAEPVFAENGLEGVRRVEQEPGGFRLIVMDIQMPVMDGYEATSKIRSMGVTTPILVVTANALESDRDRCFAMGCDGYLSKPVDFTRFVESCIALVEPPLQEAA